MKACMIKEISRQALEVHYMWARVLETRPLQASNAVYKGLSTARNARR